MTEHMAGEASHAAGEPVRAELARCQAELAALRESAAAWHDIFCNAPVALSLASAADGRVREVNACYSALLGAPPEALLGRLLSDLHMLPEGAPAESIARELSEHSSIECVANHYHRSDGVTRSCVSSMRLVQVGAETLILSSTRDSTGDGAGAQALPAAPDPRVADLEAELAAHRMQEQHLIGEIGELCTEASLLKSDIIRLKQMQQELSDEMETLRKRAVLAAANPAASGAAHLAGGAVANIAQQPPSARAAADADGSANDALWGVASARLQHVEEQLIKHAAALRQQARHMQTVSSGA